jgi:hypothetical protein
MWLFYAAILIFTDMEYLMNHIVEPQSSKSIPHLPLAKPNPSRAKRLAKTKGMSREQWLQVRKQGIGSSDAAAACGLNPHMSMLELWMIKTGRMQNQPDQPTQNSYSPLYWGNQLEPLIANYYQHKTGHKCVRSMQCYSILILTNTLC